MHRWRFEYPVEWYQVLLIIVLISDTRLVIPGSLYFTFHVDLVSALFTLSSWTSSKQICRVPFSQISASFIIGYRRVSLHGPVDLEAGVLCMKNVFTLSVRFYLVKKTNVPRVNSDTHLVEVCCHFWNWFGLSGHAFSVLPVSTGITWNFEGRLWASNMAYHGLGQDFRTWGWCLGAEIATDVKCAQGGSNGQQWLK